MANSFALDSYVTLVAQTSLVGSFTLPPTRTEQSDCRPRLRPLWPASLRRQFPVRRDNLGQLNL